MNDEELEKFPIITEIPVRWGDMDSFGHVNNTMFFRYFETARIDLFYALESYQSWRDKGVGPILAYTDCRFIAPLQYPDTVLAGARVQSLEDTEMIIEHVLYSEQKDTKVAQGEAHMVWYDYKNAKREQISVELREEFLRLS